MKDSDNIIEEDKKSNSNDARVLDDAYDCNMNGIQLGKQKSMHGNSSDPK